MVLWSLAASVAFGIAITACILGLILMYQVFFTNKRFKSELVMIQVSCALVVFGSSILHYLFV